MTSDDAATSTPTGYPGLDEEVAELTAGIAEELPAGGLATRLADAHRDGRKLRVKLGIDPSGTDLTLGHAVVLRKLRQFQDFGHTAVLIVGDFTGRVGDPTGRNEVRKVQTAEDTLANSATYLDQVQRILSPDHLEVRHNSEWLGPMTFADVLGYTRLMTVARLLERDDFSKRYKGGQPISLMEFMYPLMQGLDSVFIDADVELGGTDQTYNNLVGRNLQTQMGREPQIVVTLPLLRGTDGADKMGKSLGNFIAISEPPRDQYGKVLSIADDQVQHYAELCCSWNRAEVAASAELLATDPFAAKRAVARRIVELYWGAEEADAAAGAFDKRRAREFVRPDRDTTRSVTLDADLGDPIDIVELLVVAGLAKSKREAREFIANGAIKIDGEAVPPGTTELARAALDDRVLQRGKNAVVWLDAPG